MLGNYEDARDAVAEALTRAWAKLGQLRDECCAAAWFAAINRNEVYNYRKSQFRYPEGVNERICTACKDETEELAERELIEITMQRLEPADSEILRLIFIEQKSYLEAAKRLGITEACVNSRVHRARRRFAKIYRELAKDGLK